MREYTVVLRRMVQSSREQMAEWKGPADSPEHAADRATGAALAWAFVEGATSTVAGDARVVDVVPAGAVTP